MMEVFKPIPGHDGHEVSDQGTVRSLDRIIERNGKPARLCGRVLSLRRHTQGYRAVSLGYGKQATVHSLVMLAFEGPRPHGAWINHINGDKTDNRLINLEYCTPKQNQEHAVHTGLAPIPPGGDQLTTEQVQEIDAALKSGVSTVALARKYGVTRAMISHIRTGRAWQWLTGNSIPPKLPKLSAEDREQIKALLSEGRTGREVAKLFGVTPSVVSSIKNGRRNYAN
jgi:transposase-like protein